MGHFKIAKVAIPYLLMPCECGVMWGLLGVVFCRVAGQRKRWVNSGFGIDGNGGYKKGEAFNQENVLSKRLHGLDQQMERKGDKSLYFMDRIWVPLEGGVRTVIMDETHKSKYSVFPERNKNVFLTFEICTESGAWEMKMRVFCYLVSDCLVLLCKEFFTKLPRLRMWARLRYWVGVDKINQIMHHFLAIRKDYSTEKLARLYTDEIVVRHGVHVSIISDRDAWSPMLWAKIREGSLIGPELVQETTDKVVVIKEKLKAARDRQKSYADNRRQTM
ncbi:hypothetical protein Tco_0120935 [Tanacetum coccineum]